MAETTDVFRYISYLRLRWLWIAASSAVAAAIALAVSLAMPREYTATARIVVEPPAASDMRAAMAVSPIYLESLKTYEHFAAGDSLFRKAIDQFGLRAVLGARPIESLKRRVLKVGIVRNTRILEISATLPDARKAQALAQFVAEATVNLTRATVNEGDQDLIHGIEQQRNETQSRLMQSEEAWARIAANEPVDELKSTMENAVSLRSDIQRRAASLDLEVSTATGSDLAELQTRLAQMRKQIEGINRFAAQREKMLAERSAHLDRAESERKARQAELAAIETKLREARGDAGSRGERLRIIDPGIVPERPSSPNLPLNVAAALLVGLVLPVLYLALEMNWQEQKVSGRRGVYHE